MSISGDFDPVAMEAKLRATFEPLAKVSPLPPHHEAFHDPSQSVYFINKEDVNQSNIEIMGLGTDRRNPDVPSLAVMNEILGGGFGSRLFQKVRTELGLAYAVGGGYGFDYDHPGMFRVMVMTKSASTVDATKAALTEIAGMNEKPFTEAELKRAKDDILNSFLFRYDTREKVLAESVRLEFYGYPANYLETYKAALEKVSLADLGAVAKKYIHPDKLAVLVVGNGPEIKPGLDELAPGPAHPIDITIPQPKAAAGAGEQAVSKKTPAARRKTEAGRRDYGCRQRDAPQIAKAEGAAPGRRKAAAAARDCGGGPRGEPDRYFRGGWPPSGAG